MVKRQKGQAPSKDLRRSKRPSKKAKWVQDLESSRKNQAYHEEEQQYSDEDYQEQYPMPLSSGQRGTQDSPLSSGQGAVQQQHPRPLSSGQGAAHDSQDRSSLRSGQGIAEYTEQGNSYQGTGFAQGLPTAASTLSRPKASQAGTLSSRQVSACPTNLEAMVKDTIGRLLPSIISEAVRATRAQASDPAPTGDPSPMGDSTPVGGLAPAGDLVPAGNLAPQPSTAAVQGVKWSHQLFNIKNNIVKYIKNKYII